MKGKVVAVLLGLMLTGFATGLSYAEKGPGEMIPLMNGEKCGHEEGVSGMGFMRHRGLAGWRSSLLLSEDVLLKSM